MSETKDAIKGGWQVVAKKLEAQLAEARDAKRIAESESLAVAAELDEANAQLVEAQSLRQDANAAFQAFREAGLMAGTRPVTLSNLAAKAKAHIADLQARLANEATLWRAAVDEGKRLEAALAAAHARTGDCLNCGRGLPPDGDCYGCAADMAWAENASLKAHLAEANARTATLRKVINRIAAQVGHPPIAPGEIGIESVAEAVARRLEYAREREETLDSITPENLQAFAASEAHHHEHHEREATLRELLRQIEWEGEHYDGDSYRVACVRCGGARSAGHKPKCDLAQAVAPKEDK